MAGALPGTGVADDLTSQTGSGSVGRASSGGGGDLAGTTGTVQSIAGGGGGVAAGGNPTTPTSGGTAPTTQNPNAAGASSNAMNQLVSMKVQSSPDAQQNIQNDMATKLASQNAGLLNTYNPNGSPTGVAASGNLGSLISDAKQWIGTPYVYGGTSRSGVDCSGFTQAVYGQMGVNIGRDTSAQFKSGQAVGQDGNWNSTVQALQPGDLIFYGQPGASGPNAHVVMYIGNGQIIQAAHTGTNVSIGQLFNSASSDEPFLGARRYMSSSATPQGGAGQYGQILQSSPIGNQQDFAADLLRGLGDPTSQQNIASLVNWENREGGNWHNPDTFNPLNTTEAYDGSHGTNGPGVQAYKSWLDGLSATASTLQNGRYADILAALKAGKGLGGGSYGGLSTWSGGGYSSI